LDLRLFGLFRALRFAALLTIAISALLLAECTWLHYGLKANPAAMPLAAAPVDGSHYFVDVLTGIAIAILCLVLAHKLVGRVSLIPATTMPLARARSMTGQGVQFGRGASRGKVSEVERRGYRSDRR
jgi:hypothetical protein